MLKQAYIIGMTRALTNAGLLPEVPFYKVAEGAEIAANATPQEVQVIGSSIGPQDLESMMKILEVLSMLFDQYQQQQQGGMPPPGAPPGGMPPPGAPPGGMPPPGAPPGGMPPPGAPPGGMPPPGM